MQSGIPLLQYKPCVHVVFLLIIPLAKKYPSLHVYTTSVPIIVNLVLGIEFAGVVNGAHLLPVSCL